MKLAIQGPLDSFEVSHARYRHPHTGRRPSGNLCMPVEFRHTESSSFDISHRQRLSEHESSLFYEWAEWLLVNRGLESSRWD